VERPALVTPFGTLLHFDKPSVPGQPRVLVVGPMSGHFTTLIRPTIRTLLADHDVYAIDWHNARNVPVEHGPFGLDEYIEHVMAALRHLGPDTHVLAVCQPAVPVLAAVALLAEADDPAQPASVTLMAGPIDTRVNPNRVNTSACGKPLSWFERRLIDTVPGRYAGAGRRVYPGVVQLTAFMSMNPKRHLGAHARMYRDLVTGNTAAAATTRAFYDEYGAVMDVPAEFYLETVGRVFQQHELPLGRFTWRGRRVDPGAIRDTALLTGGGRERRHLLPRPDRGGPPAVHRDPGGAQAPPPAERGGPLRRLQRLPLGGRDLPRRPVVHRVRPHRRAGCVPGLTDSRQRRPAPGPSASGDADVVGATVPVRTHRIGRSPCTSPRGCTATSSNARTRSPPSAPAAPGPTPSRSTGSPGSRPPSRAWACGTASARPSSP
jgi:hypothetical protein